MKKILLATTVLSMSAGFAAADVSVSGDARMGVVSSDSVTTFSSRARIKFSGSGTTDAGLSFGGSFRANDAQGAKAGTAGSVFISGAFGKISMGDVDSADNAAVGQLASVGYTGLGSGNSISYAADGFDLLGLASSITKSAPKASTLDDHFDDNEDPDYGDYDYYSLATTVTGGAAAKVLYTYSANGLSVNASAGQISNSGSHTSYALGVAYTTGGLTLAAGYGSNEWDFESKVSHTRYTYDPEFGVVIDDASTHTDEEFVAEGDVTDSSLSATYVMGATTLKAIYQDKEVSDNIEGYSMSATSMGLSVQHKIDTLTLTAYYINTDLTDDLVSDGTSVSFARSGIGASYDLGGGASITGGVANIEVPALVGTGIDDGDIEWGTLETTSYTAYDFGVNFSF